MLVVMFAHHPTITSTSITHIFIFVCKGSCQEWSVDDFFSHIFTYFFHVERDEGGSMEPKEGIKENDEGRIIIYY
jgi:hypothetical protein